MLDDLYPVYIQIRSGKIFLERGMTRVTNGNDRLCWTFHLERSKNFESIEIARLSEFLLVRILNIEVLNNRKNQKNFSYNLDEKLKVDNHKAVPY